MKKSMWERIKNTTADELIKALEKDGFVFEGSSGATRGYTHPDRRRIVIHYHPGKTFGAKLLKALIKDIGWLEKDLKRLKLI